MKYILNSIARSAKCWGVVLCAAICLVACNDMLSVDSKNQTSADDYNLTSSGDSVFSTIGVLSRLQKIADTYVLLGELRGDLMTISDKADVSLQEISTYSITKDNKYVHLKDYYDVINNCNYIIQKLDTGVVDGGIKHNLRLYAAIKGIRAWTYMQIALNFKTVHYYDKAILTVAEAESHYPEYNIQQLFTLLIDDLTPLKEVSIPTLGSVDGYSLSYSFFDINILLGDLYLWRASLLNNQSDYEQAALAYYKVIHDNFFVMNKTFSSSWATINNTINTKSATLNWIQSNTYEAWTKITCPTENGAAYWLDTLNNQRIITPSAQSLANWDQQVYFLNAASNVNGDLRKYGSISYNDATNKSVQTDFSFTGMKTDKFLIYKYKLYSKNVTVYKKSLVYLRFAEALNRLNKPTVAFAILKYGLTPANISNPKIVSPTEKGNPTLPYLTFETLYFGENQGIHMRGCGNTDKDTTYYIFPKNKERLLTMRDSVQFVETKILDELALETAFEGNRFQDLMRFTYRRINAQEGDASFLANLVAKKNGTVEEGIKSTLLNPDNWFILYK